MEENKKIGPKDVFMHLLVIIFLYVCVISFGALIFKYINIYFPDILKGEFGQANRNSLRWPISVLIIIFPAYIWLSSYLQKDLIKNPEKRELKIRKWLLYFTLFLSTIVIVIDLVTLVFQFLSGGLSVPFLLKVLTVFIIAISVFLYYGWNIKKDIPASSHPKMKIFVRGVIILASISIIFGFFIVGSPQAERLRQFDERRTNDFSTLQWQIVDYWQNKEKLPISLDQLKDDITGFIPPKDPETGMPYEYLATGDKSFELCANFKTSNKEEKNNSIMKPSPEPSPVESPFITSENWFHDLGRTCFSRTIDPDKFPPRKK